MTEPRPMPHGHPTTPVSGVRGKRAGGFHFYLTDDDRARLNGNARAAGCSAAQTIREWIRTLPPA
jgi:hypothetical protein